MGPWVGAWGAGGLGAGALRPWGVGARGLVPRWGGEDDGTHRRWDIRLDRPSFVARSDGRMEILPCVL